MPHIGCHLSSSKGFYAMGQTALSIGASTFQFFTRNPRGSKAKALDVPDAQKLAVLMRAHAFGPIVAHAPYTINPCSAEVRTREFALETMRDDLQRLESVENCLYNFHPGSHVGQGAAAGIEQIATTLNAAMFQGQKTMVLLETMSGKGSEIGAHFEELRAIIDRVKMPDMLGVCMDLCHVSDAGYDVIGDFEGVLAEFDRVIGLSRLRAIHVNDSQNPPGSHKDRHARIGEGFLGLETVARAVHHPRLQALPFILETPNELDGYAREIALLENCAKD